MWKVVVIAALISGNVAAATTRPEVSWLIMRREAKPVLVQVWADRPVNPSLVWRVLSASGVKLSQMPEPSLVDGYEYSYGECTAGGKLAPEVIAEIKVGERSPVALEVRRAWALDPASKTFKESDPHGLVCYNSDYGF